MCQILDDNYYIEKYLIQTRLQVNSSVIKSWKFMAWKEFRSQYKAQKNNIPSPNKEIWKGYI